MSLTGRPLRVYLDAADLHRIADGQAAPDDQKLREAIAEFDARIVCSLAHVMDLMDANDATVARWTHVIGWLGRAEWIYVEDGTARFEEFRLGDVAPPLALLRSALLPVRTLRHAGALEAREAHASSKSQPPVSGRQIREGAAAILDGPFGQLIASAADSLGETRDSLLAKVAARPEDALVRGDVVDAIHLRLDADRDRRPKTSDMADAHHLQALPHVDVFTADGYTATKIEQTLRGAPGSLPHLARLVPVFRLDEVATALREAAR